jgi:hypothetical protein
VRGPNKIGKNCEDLHGRRFSRHAEEHRKIKAGIICNLEGDRRADDEAVNWIAARVFNSEVALRHFHARTPTAVNSFYFSTCPDDERATKSCLYVEPRIDDIECGRNR